MARKILVVTDLFLKRFDTSAEQIKSFIIECNSRSIEVEYVIPKEPCQLVSEFLSGIDFRYTVINDWWNKKDIEKRNNLKVAFKVWEIIKNKKIDLVEFNFCVETTVFITSILCKMSRLKSILIWRQHSGAGFIRDRFLIMAVKKIVNKLKVLSWVIDFLMVLSERQKSILMERKIEGSKICVLPNGVKCERFRNVIIEENYLKDLGIKSVGKIVVTIATLTPVKGIEYLLHAAKSVICGYPDTQFLIVGEGPLLESLKNLAIDFGIKDSVHFLGRRNDVEKILFSSDIFVLASLSEAFPFTVIEAMAAEKPVIATNVGAIPEIIINNKSGLIVPVESSSDLADAMFSLLSDNVLMRKMGEAGKEIVEKKYRLEQVVSRYVERYVNIINKK
jgi:glycosyltransferase involved in cell wall biosynthesis